MKLFYAHYPSLEDAFVRYARETRPSALTRWLVVCSSALTAQRLKDRLAHELGAAANFYFMTAGGLVGELDREAPGEVKPLFPQDNLRDFLIKNLLSEPGLNRYPVSRGFVQAVKSSLRDLADALADPDVLDEHLRTSPDAALELDGERLAWFNQLYRRYLAAEASVPGFRPYAQAFERALKQVENSPFLRSFEQIVFYGFYDMTGRQLELFRTARGAYATAVFAPYQKHPAYQFAKKFFETNWLGSAEGQNAETGRLGALGQTGACLFSPEKSAPAPQGVQLVSAADARGEVFFVAKEILRLVEKEGYSFADIGVIARSAAPYQDELRRTFKANCIPLDASFTYPLSKFALGAFCLNLFSLAFNGFDRETVLAVLSSPYFKNPRKYAWRTLVTQSLVSRDFSQWGDLLPQTKNYDPELLSWLETVKNALGALDGVSTWSDGAALALEFLKQNTDEASFAGKDGEIYRAVCDKINSLSAYAAVRARVEPGEWVRELTDALAALSFNEAEAVQGGVTFTDASRARGLQFKAVFLLGLNDKSFPLITPEDPVLRDYYRYVLRDVLGYWINQSLDRSSEERLLFFAAATAAQEKLYALYARTGADGKAAVPSVFLTELARAGELDLQAGDAPRISGRLSERLTGVDPVFLTPKEISLAFVLHPETALANYTAAGLLSPQVSVSLGAAAQLRQSGALNDYDGQISSGAEIFAAGNEKGFSPSSLQELAQCPMKYFFDKGLRLGDPDEPLSRRELSPDRRGDVYHKILKDFYEELYQKKLTHELFDSAALDYLARVMDRYLPPDGYRTYGIYAVVWALITEDIRSKLSAFVLEDLHQLGPFMPACFEQEVSAGPTDEMPFRLRGIIDRVDVDETAKTFRVADYKSSRKGTKNLAADFFKQLIFQPFIYVWMALQLPQWKGYTSAGSCLLSINKGYVRRDLPQSAFEEMRPRAADFLKMLTDFIQRGDFFLCPSDGCKYCPYAAICRRDSFKSLLRARKSAAGQMLEEARQ